MKNLSATLLASMLVLISSETFAVPRPPEYIKISITRDSGSTGFQGIIMDFEWYGANPDFSADHAVEFEIIILTTKPKCFGQPPGGKDNNVKLARVINIPNPYTDVWNYYWPTDYNELISDLETNCTSINDDCRTQLWWHNPDRSDHHANFAVGSRSPHLFAANTRYSFRYPLELPNDPDCNEYDDGLGWVQINMVIMPNTCTHCGAIQHCPHFIGYPNCSEYKFFRENVNEGQECRSIIKRLCAPTITYEFSPYNIGFADVLCGDDSQDGGECNDNDHDGFFATFSDSSGNWVTLFGSHIGDCDDTPQGENIHNENYDEETGMCLPPGGCEIDCTNGLDDDEDGLTDCDDPDCQSTQECYQEENNCDNNIDDDNDDLTDCDDPDCLLDENCIWECPHACLPNDTTCNGTQVWQCAQDQCDFEYWYTCNANETCTGGSCISQTAPAPVITNVVCNSVFRGDTTSCTIYGSNFTVNASSSTYIEHMGNRTVIPGSSTQFTVQGTWNCIDPLGFKDVSHRNPDGQRDDAYNAVETIMGELVIDSYYQHVVYANDTNVEMGVVGCNFGSAPVFWFDGILADPSTLQVHEEDHVSIFGDVTNPPGTYNMAIAKFSGATSNFDRKDIPNAFTILP